MSLYHEGAEVVVASSTEGGSLKSRTFGRRNIKSKPGQLYALVFETCKWSMVLKEVIDSSEILSIEKKLTPVLALLLVHDLLLAKGGVALPKTHGLRVTIEKHKARLTSELTRARLRRKAPTMEALKEQIDRAAAGEEAQIPRWVRINTIKTTIEEQLNTTFKGYDQVTTIHEVLAPSTTPTGGKQRRILIDPHIPNLVAITQGIDLSKTEAYAEGRIIFQDKASCFPAYLLDPHPEDGDVIDGCAAPGNKTTHLAAVCHARRPDFVTPDGVQRIFAFEKDKRRSQTLTKMVKIAGAQGWTRVGFGQDFCQVDPAGAQFAKVGALLLDPSCSGSGIVGRDTMPELHLPGTAPGTKAGQGKGRTPNGKEDNKTKKRKLDDREAAQNSVMIDDEGNETVVNSEKDLEARLQALAGFQLKILLHALTFPAAKKVTYSTCSIHSQENEDVVMKVLKSEVAQRRGWRIMKRAEQVRGMRDWPVRGLRESCDRDAEVADACIRSYKGDGLGVMGFFVAGFVRDGSQDEEAAAAAAAAEDPDGPYIRDESGMIMRDAAGMPYLKTTGRPVELLPRDESEEEEEEEEEDEDMDEDGPYVRDAAGLILRDDDGLPFLKRKSKAGDLAVVEESEEDEEDEEDDDSDGQGESDYDSEVDEDGGSGSNGDSEEDGDEDEGDWDGFDD
ncbi:NOL1/NOP2/Sun domain family [Cordyceps fumosorosea ARSEF 2679]|uniref:NOL1/NOP2/Sun domain family n=1 Tax=Cordyceps fumosorosea (strain ARSEF 2679) TaxID=1081104 RepID=A0A162JDT0_CORFA|nr:NOL1/NOP2/Sun domain family [Cordyceps fumosorosea ARSEF 2679]OAA67472.1 NOL1/NOP2/Sun domain family [Cordyceps fumosorosea ARSEF 2679]